MKGKPARELITWSDYRFPASLPPSTFQPPEPLPHATSAIDVTARIKPAYVAGLVAFVVTALISRLHPTPYNNFVLLAQALLHGHAWIDWPGAYIDALPYGGRYYVIEAPLPALLLLPFVAIFGAQTNQTLLGVLS